MGFILFQECGYIARRSRDDYLLRVSNINVCLWDVERVPPSWGSRDWGGGGGVADDLELAAGEFPLVEHQNTIL